MKKLFFYFVLLVPVLTFAQALNGNYVIGQNQPAPYKTLTTAINHLKQSTVGMSGPVTFLLNDETYYSLPGETFPIVISTIPTTATKTLTIKPNVGKNVTINAPLDLTQAVIKLNGADNLIIDGSNSINGTSRNLTFINSSNISYENRTTIWLSSVSGNSVDNIKIINTKMRMTNRNGFYAMLSGIFSGGGVVDFTSNAAAQNKNLVINNNEFINVRRGVLIQGSSSATQKSKNITIASNVMGSSVIDERPSVPIDIKNVDILDIQDNSIVGFGNIGQGNFLAGIKVEASSNFNIKRNNIREAKADTNGFIGYGIQIVGATTNAVISENKIIDFENLETSRVNGIGIEVTTASSGIVIANNFVGDLYSGGLSTNTALGIDFLIGGTGTKVYHNTIVMNNTMPGWSNAIFFENGTNYDFRNNILVNNSATDNEGTVVVRAKTGVTFTQSNYNNYYGLKIGRFQDTQYPTLANWKTATGKDQYSISVNPVFVSPTDLHLQSVLGNAALDNSGANLFSVVPKDIDGQDRSTTPDMGADEFSAVPAVPIITASPTQLAAFVSCAQTTSASQSFTISGANLTADMVVIAPAGFEVSKDDTTFSNSITFAQVSGSVANSVVYVRMTPTSTAVSGNITVTSSQAVTKSISVSGAIGATTTYNGSTWSAGFPTSAMTAVINGAYNLSASINACSLTIKSGAVVTIPAEYDVTLNGALTVESGASFTLASNTNLIQNTNAQNSGIINVQRESSKLYRLDYTMWGSPLYGTTTSTSQILKNFSPNTVDSRFYTYNSTTDVFNSVLPTTPFAVGKGYLIRMPDDHTIFAAGVDATSWTGTFVGTPNNGDINVSLVHGQNGFNLLANPYPSLLDANKFLADNATQIGGTLYFWRRRNNVPTGSETTSAYYATYTYAGGAAVVSNSSSSTNGGQTFVSVAPNGFIQVGQGFIVQKLESSPAAGIVVFKNSMRTATNNDNQFFKNASIENSGRVWLNVTNAAGEFGQTLVAYLAEAENGLDFTDGKYLNDGSTALTSWLDNTEYIIQGRAPFESSDVVDLNFKTATAGTYTIAIDHVDGLFEVSQDIFLRDNVLNVLHDLKASSYTFATEAGSFNNRFDLVYQNPLAVDSPTFSSNSVVLFKNQNNIVINSGNNLLEMVEVFDIRGRVLAVAKNIQANEISINVGTTNQVLIVKITSADGISITKKTIN